MKLSVTLTGRAEQALLVLVQEHSAKVSSITETAIMYFSQQPAAQRDSLIRGIKATKKAYTRGRWRAAFWEAMRDEFWLPRLLSGRRTNDFAPLTFVGFQVWFLLNSLADPDPEDAPFNLQIMSNAMEARFERAIQQQLDFRRDQSPYEAAREAADFLRTRALAAGTLEYLALEQGRQLLIDYAGPHWMARPDIDASRFPLFVTGRWGKLRLNSDHRITPVS